MISSLSLPWPNASISPYPHEYTWNPYSILPNMTIRKTDRQKKVMMMINTIRIIIFRYINKFNCSCEVNTRCPFQPTWFSLVNAKLWLAPQAIPITLPCVVSWYYSYSIHHRVEIIDSVKFLPLTQEEVHLAESQKIPPLHHPAILQPLTTHTCKLKMIIRLSLSKYTH